MKNECFNCRKMFLSVPFRTMEEGPYCKEQCYEMMYPEDTLPLSTEQNPMKDIIIDLVTLAIKANDVVIKGNFSGSMSDEVNSLLKMCKEIHDEYVEPSK